MRILITGGNGQLGRALQRTLPSDDVLAFDHAEFDITDRRTQTADLADWELTHVINAGALTDTVRCERNPLLSDFVNKDAPVRLAASIDDGTRFVQISTNEVFGRSAQKTPYVEESEPRPLNAYGDSKAEAERSLFDVHPDTMNIRTAWLYGDGANNFVAKVLSAAGAGKPLRFVTDEIATPTNADDLAIAIKQLIEQDAPPGIYHLTNEGEASRYEWACEILRLAGMNDVAVEPITTEQLYASGYDGPHKPRYSVLANTRARALGITLRPWKEALADHFAKYRAAAQA